MNNHPGTSPPPQSASVESVWDYPRPPRLEATPRRIMIVHAGITIADTREAVRILETSHPPVYYIAPADLRMAVLRPSESRGSFCEFKGVAVNWTLSIPGSPEVNDVAWSYPKPSAGYAALAGRLAFYASRVDVCRVDDERVVPQPGDFYGGWITSDLRGPFKGAPGTRGW